MASNQITQLVDDLIARGRVQTSMRDQYINLLAANPDLEQEFSMMFLRGSDYTNKTKQLAQERQQYDQRLQQEWQKLQGERQKLEQWQGQVQGELSKLDALPEMTAKIAAYEQALKDYGVFDQVTPPAVGNLAKTYNTPPPAPPKQQQQEEGDYMTLKAAGAALRDFATLQSKVFKIQAQHMKLFREPLDDDLIGHYLDTGEDPERYWAVKYGVEAKKSELFNAERLAHDARVKEEARAELMKELALDPTRVTGVPGIRPQGGLSPHLENFMHSRATAHSQNALGGTPPPVTANDFVVPEKKHEIQASRERVAAASEMYNRHFDLTGNPTTDRGKQLFDKYKE